MKRVKSKLCMLIILVFAICMLPTGVQSVFNADPLGPEDIIYSLMTDRYFDGDNTNNGTLNDEYRPGELHYYQGGDWAGLTSTLDYIKDLGYTAIWISPPQDNWKFSRSGDEAGYHGYYTRDYNSCNPHFGTSTELQTLINEAHDRGMKIILDAVFNHTADYLEYPSTTYDPPDYKPAYPFDNPDWYHNNPNITDWSDEYQLHNYSLGGLDDLAQENTDCWNAIKSAYSGWFNYGFSGARVDAALLIPKQYLQLFEEHVGMATFGEAYETSVDVIADFQNYIWSMLDFPLYFKINDVFCKGNSWSDIKGIFDQDYKYKNAKRLITFIDNHDRPRFLNNAYDNYAKTRMAMAFLYTVRGIPCVYYGTEQAMAGIHQYSDAIQNDVNRAMMSSFDQTGTLYKWNKRLNQVRKDYKSALVYGNQRELYYSSSDPVYAISRRNDSTGDEVVGIFNYHPSTQTRTIYFNPATCSWTIGTKLTDLLNTDRVVTVEEGATQGSRKITLEIPGNTAIMLTNGYPDKFLPSTQTQTKVIIHYNAGWGNSIYIRGDTEPLTWSWGQKCENVDTGTWQYVMERPASGQIEFKVLINDTTWETGNNHIVNVGNTINIYPSF